MLLQGFTGLTIVLKDSNEVKIVIRFRRVELALSMVSIFDIANNRNVKNLI